MNLKFAVCISLLAACSAVGLPQTVITGSVLNARSEAVDAYVTASAKGAGTIVGFADTDSNGFFKLEFESPADSIIVTADGMGIARMEKVVANRPQELKFRAEAKSIQLKEVSVKAKKITQQGDTLNYLVGAFQQQADRTIGDVLKRMPGIEVADNGGIKFNGRSISKFYVEDMDLLAGRYGLATNNVNASDVAAVQVLENHQSVKVLQGRQLSDDVAINLKLKESAKGTLAVNALIGAGVQQAGEWKLGSRPISDSQTIIGRNPLWTAELTCMYFAKRRQNMTIYKGGNTGDDLAKELTVHNSEINGVNLYPFCPTDAVMPSGSGLPQKRTFDNLSNILAMNHLEKLNQDTELGLNIVYHNDLIRREGSSVGNYFISEENRLLTTETLTGETKVNNLNVRARFNRNAPDGFMANVLKFDADWNSDRVDGLIASERTGSDPAAYGNDRVRQHFDRPQFSVSNTFNTIRNIGRNSFNLHFSAGFAHRPNTLSVEIDSLLQETHASYSQEVDSRHIAARFNTAYSIRPADKFTLNYGIIASANLHAITTALDGFSPPAESSQLINDLWYNTYCIALSQSYKYETRNFDITLGLPLELYRQTLDDKVRKDKHAYTHLLFAPSLSLNGSITPDLRFNAGGYYSKSVGDPGGIYSGYIMTNYRTFQRSFVDQLSETKNYGANAGLRYRSVIHAFFGNLSFNYRHARDNQIYGYTYEGATSVVQPVNKPTRTDYYGLGSEAGKGFDFLNSDIRLFANFALSESDRLVDMTVYRYHARRLNFGGSLSFKPFGWMGLVYACGFGQSRNYTEGHRDGATLVRNNTQRLSINLYPTKKLTLTLAAEDNYSNLTAEKRHARFGDFAAKLRLKHIDLELQLNNIFDQRRYTFVSYTGLDIFSRTSQLRPRNLLLSIRFKVL